eukprot:CAMPEP_0185157196 /NCGR_PEP_ID=MMETSP1139-20130426/1610_1 /TAXON_ID=298111 /ORGANISM="Pavlova sp., Strain CCMP459" /LENGTH=105 /DNA_ID=CAMNT_0027722261 /DNA_START=862 /DNA_END=1179 /DNA_ORIENTATION=+
MARDWPMASEWENPQRFTQASLTATMEKGLFACVITMGRASQSMDSRRDAHCWGLAGADARAPRARCATVTARARTKDRRESMVGREAGNIGLRGGTTDREYGLA